jgi:hypothetical protein
MSQHLTDLSHLDQLLVGTAPAESKSFESVPNGKYQVFVDKAYVNKSEKTGNDQLIWELVILAGPYKKRRLFHRNTLLTQDNVRWLLHDLQVAGVPPITTMNELHDRVKALLDVVLEVSVRNKQLDDSSVANIYLNKRLTLEIPADVRGSGGQEHDLTPF